MTSMLLSSFERASKPRESVSNPVAGDCWTTLKPESFRYDGLRPFESPEAVKGFTLQAYRPSSLPMDIPRSALTGKAEEEGSVSSADSMEDSFTQLSSTTQLQWPDLDSGAVSICGSPMLRTDVPLTYFQPPRDCRTPRRSSMDACSMSESQPDLAPRSASAPAMHETLEVDDLWKNMPQFSGFNPFANVPDNEKLFSQ